KEEETSYVIFMFQMVPVFVIVLSYVMLHETISGKQLLGFFLILFSALALSRERGQKIFRLSRRFWWLVMMDFLWALASVLITFAIHVNSFSKILSYESWGIGLGGLLLYIVFPSVRRSFNQIIRTVRKKILAVMFVNEGWYVLSKS